MKKAIFILGGLTAVYIGFVVVTKEACACTKPSSHAKLLLSFLVENVKKTNTDFTNICNSPSIKNFDKDLADNKIDIDVECASDSDNFTLQTKLPNKTTFCIDKDSQIEGVTIRKGAISCE